MRTRYGSQKNIKTERERKREINKPKRHRPTDREVGKYKRGIVRERILHTKK
jgi:hypothetical protein